MPKKPRNIIQLFLVVSLGIFCVTLFNFPAYSGEIEDLEDQINQTNEELAKKKGILSDIEKKIAEISGSNYSLSQKISLINDEITKLKKSIDSTEADLNKKIAEIEEKQVLLEKKKESIDTFSSDLYIQSRYRMSQFFLSRDSWDGFVEGLFVKKRAITVLRDEVEKINGEFISLAESREALEKQKTELEEQKGDLDKSYALLAAEKAKLQKELNAQYSTKSSVSASIAELNKQLSSSQKALIALRTGGTVINPDSIPSGNDLGSLKYFNSSAPSGYFGVFSFGAYTYRNGMSQWGAKARADAGQKYDQILKFYYPGFSLGRQTVPEKIKVQFCDPDPVTKQTVCTKAGKPYCLNSKIVDYDFEDFYMRGIYEMSESWNLEVLKAQVVAARTFALRVTSNGRNPIRADECGQVFKPQLKTGNWATAVVATQGGDKNNPYVMKNSSGTYASGSFAAVTGGWINGGVGWDTTDGSGSGDWVSRSWESKSGVSWFYKIWYRTGYTSGTTVNADSCYRKPWLSQAEMADILNSYMLWKKIDLKGTPDLSRIYPIKDSCHPSGAYTHSQVKSFINKPVTSISSVTTSSSNGTTNSVTFNTNRGVMVLDGTDFKYIYNLRAPGHLRIQQYNFVHINVQMK